jgi:predicted DNA-binding ribbon-helix-helix protein
MENFFKSIKIYRHADSLTVNILLQPINNRDPSVENLKRTKDSFR